MMPGKLVEKLKDNSRSERVNGNSHSLAPSSAQFCRRTHGVSHRRAARNVRAVGRRDRASER
jgi:hypothetical protein